MPTNDRIRREVALLLETGRSREDVLRLYPATDRDAVGAEYDLQYSAWPAPWLARVYHTEDVDAAIDLVLETLDDLLGARDEERLREALTSLDVERVPTEVLLAFLMSTFRARAARQEAGRGDRGASVGACEGRDPELLRAKVRRVPALPGAAGGRVAGADLRAVPRGRGARSGRRGSADRRSLIPAKVCHVLPWHGGTPEAAHPAHPSGAPIPSTT